MKGVIFCNNEKLSAAIIRQMEELGVFVETAMGKEALKNILSSDLDLLFLELPMQGLSRGELFQVLNRLWEKGIATVLIKDKDYPVRRSDLEGGKAVIIEKPVNEVELRKKLEAFVRTVSERREEPEPDTVFEPTLSMDELKQKELLSPDEAFIFSYIDGHTSYAQLKLLIPMDPEKIAKAVKKFLKQGYIKRKPSPAH